jgi:hypothetical protein
LILHSAEAGAARLFAVWLQVEDGWRFAVVPAAVAELELPPGTSRCHVTAVSRTGVESAPAVLEINRAR